MCKESTGRQDHSDTGGSTMANSRLVFTNNADVDRHSNNGSSEKQFAISSIQRDSSSAEENYELDNLSILREQFTCKGISTKTANIMLCSWRQGTKKQYKVFVKRWFQYCGERKISEIQISIATVLDFLTSLFENGLGYSSINTARSALSALGTMFDNVLVGAHLLVIRFMKGVFNLRPVRMKNVCIWDVSIVLHYLRKRSPVNTLSLQDLTYKLIMLIHVALTNATRSQTIKFLNIDYMEKLKDQYLFHLDVLLKQTRPGN